MKCVISLVRAHKCITPIPKMKRDAVPDGTLSAFSTSSMVDSLHGVCVVRSVPSEDPCLSAPDIPWQASCSHRRVIMVKDVGGAGVALG